MTTYTVSIPHPIGSQVILVKARTPEAAVQAAARGRTWAELFVGPSTRVGTSMLSGRCC